MADFPRLSRRTLFICLLASVALHAMLLLWLPGWRSPPPMHAVAPVLDVVMVVADTADVVANAAPWPRIRNVPSPPAVKSQADSLPPARSEPVAAAVPVLSTPSPPVEDTPAHGISPPPPAMAARTPAPAAPAPVTVTPPAFTAAYLRNPPPVYPAAARRGGEEGTVMLRVLVGRDGTPLKVELDQSSRSHVLDHAALDAVKGWRFVPARRGAENIEAWVRVPVSFRLES